MKLSLGAIVAAVLVVPGVEGTFFRDVVAGGRQAKNTLQKELLAKAVPLEEYRRNLRAHGYDFAIDETRNLQDNNDDYYINENYMYNFTGYSLKYAACQPVQKFSEDAINAGEYTPLITDDIVILRLCPSKSCNMIRQFGCTYNYVEYAVGISDYVRIMLRNTLDKEQQLCNYCNACANTNQRKLQGGENNENQDNQNDNQDRNENQENQEGMDEQNQMDDGGEEDMGDDAVQQDGDEDNQAGGDDGQWANDYYADDESCSDYESYCYSNGVALCNDNVDDDGGYLDTEGYLDYMGCTNVNGYYIRPRCDGYKQTISMGIYYDKFCSQYAGEKVSMNTLKIGVSPNAFVDYYGTKACIDCSESVSYDRTTTMQTTARDKWHSLVCFDLFSLTQNYPPYFSANSNLCNRMHVSAATCFSKLKDDVMFITNSSSEETACSYIESLRYGTYDEEGRLYSSYFKSATREVTDGQKMGLVASLLLCTLLAMYSCYLHHSITNLLIKSLSHTDLLPPSRSRQRSRSGSRRSRNGRRSAGNTERNTDEEWNSVQRVSNQRGMSRSRR